jgi:hypothetical protein
MKHRRRRWGIDGGDGGGLQGGVHGEQDGIHVGIGAWTFAPKEKTPNVPEVALEKNIAFREQRNITPWQSLLYQAAMAPRLPISC